MILDWLTKFMSKYEGVADLNEGPYLLQTPAESSTPKKPDQQFLDKCTIDKKTTL